MKARLFLFVVSLLVFKNVYAYDTETTQVVQDVIKQVSSSSFIEVAEQLTPEQLLELLSAQNYDGNTALMCAIHEHRSIDMVNTLLKATERLTPEQLLELLNTKNENGKTALMLAVDIRYIAITHALLDTAQRLTPEQIFRLLNARVNARDFQFGVGDNVLMMVATGYQSIETIDAILKATDKLTPELLLKLFNAGNRHESTILMMANGRDFVDAVLKSAERLTTEQFLILLNAKNKHDGNTAFQRAVYRGYESIARALLEAASKRKVMDALLQQLK